MTRLLFVTHTLDFEAGGAERVLLDVLKRIDRSRFDLSVFVGQDSKGIPLEFSELGVPLSVHTNLPVGIPFGPIGILKTAFALLRLAFELWKELDENRIEVVHINSIFALNFAIWPCLMRGVPVVYHEHGLARDRHGSPWTLLYSQMISRVNHTIAITDAVRDQVISYGSRPEATTTVHNGIEPRDPAAATFAEARAEEDNAFKIVQIANFLDWKGQDLLTEALALLRREVPQAQVTFYGHSKNLEFEQRVRERVTDLELSDAVEFGGFRTDLMQFLPRFDCLVVASRAEPFGLVLLEAMRAGVPVVASAAGGVPEIVEDGVNGLLFLPGDPAGLAESLRKIALDPKIVERLKIGGRTVMEERFSFSAQIEAIQCIFENEV